MIYVSTTIFYQTCSIFLLWAKALGVDPSINVGKIANDAGLMTLVSFFDMNVTEEIKRHYQKSDCIVASSIFTHLENPHQFIEAVKNLMTDDGQFIVEVEYIGNILADTQFERFYLDRIFYYSLTSLTRLFAEHGMVIVDVEKIEPHGGSIRVTAHNIGFGSSPSKNVTDLLLEEEKTLNPATLEKFKNDVHSQITAFRNKLLEYKQSNLKVAAYSAPARVATICNYGGIDSSLIEYIVDDSPLKQNKFSPGTHIPIVPKSYLEDHKPDILVVFAYEYIDDIRAKTGNNYRYLIPIPPREVSPTPKSDTQEIMTEAESRIYMPPLIREDVLNIIKSIRDEASVFEGKTILISGGAGFLGSYLVATFLMLNREVFRKHCKIIILDNFITSSGKNALMDIEGDPHCIFIQHDVRNPLPDINADYVIHAAGLASPYYYRKSPIETIEVAVNGTRNFLEFAKQKNIDGLLYFSSSEIYGDPDPAFIPTPETYWGNVSAVGPRACL